MPVRLQRRGIYRRPRMSQMTKPRDCGVAGTLPDTPNRDATHHSIGWNFRLNPGTPIRLFGQWHLDQHESLFSRSDGQTVVECHNLDRRRSTFRGDKGGGELKCVSGA